MACNLRNVVYLLAWVSRFFIILAVPTMGQGYSGINICSTHNSTYSSKTAIYKNSGTTNVEICQCDVYAPRHFEAKISFYFPQHMEGCGERFTMNITGQPQIQRCSRSQGAYSESDLRHYPNGHVQIIYRSNGREASSGWLRVNITASGSLIHVVCKISKTKDPPKQPAPSTPRIVATTQPTVVPENQSTPPPGTGSSYQPPSEPITKSATVPSIVVTGDPVSRTRHAASSPIASNLTVILASVIPFAALVFVAGFIGGFFFARRRKKRSEGKPNTATAQETDPRYEELTQRDRTNQAFTPGDTSHDVNPYQPLDHVSTGNQYEELSTTSRGGNRDYMSLQPQN